MVPELVLCVVWVTTTSGYRPSGHRHRCLQEDTATWLCGVKGIVTRGKIPMPRGYDGLFCMYMHNVCMCGDVGVNVLTACTIFCSATA